MRDRPRRCPPGAALRGVAFFPLHATGPGILPGLLLGGLLLPAGGEAQLPPVPLDTIPVVGTRATVDLPLRTRSVQILGRQELEALPARNVADVLRWAMGVELGDRSRAQADLSIRGAGFEQVLILVDGNRVSDPQTGHFDLNLTIPLDRVERIEILRGPASVLYGGDAVGGVVNVVTRQDPGWRLRAEAGSFRTRAVAGRGGVPLGRSGGVDLSAERGSSDGHRDGTDWQETVGSAVLRLPFLGGRLQAEGGLGDRDFGADGFYAPFPSFEATRARTAWVGWRPRGTGAVQLEPRVTWRRHEDDFVLIRDDPDFYRNQHTSTQVGGEVVARLRLTPELAAALGGEAGRGRLRSTNLGNREEDRWAAFGEAAFGTVDGVEVAAGARWDHHDRWGAFLSPSVAAAYPLGDDLLLRGSWGRAFRGPSWTERHYTDPNHRAAEDLLPEESKAWEAGFRWVEGDDFTLDAVVFRRSARNLIDWARPHGSEELWETRNVTEARFRGLEAEARWDLGRGSSFFTGGSWLSLSSGAEDGMESKQALRPLRDQWIVGLTRILADGSALTVRAVRARRSGEESYREVDLRVEVPFLEGRVYLDLRNLTGSEHPDLTGNPVPGRSFYVGYRVGSR